MKHLVSIAILFLAAASFAQNSDERIHEHHGFYSNISAGFTFTSLEQHPRDYYSYSKKYGEYDYREMEDQEFVGYSFPAMEFKFGFSAFNLIAFYTVFNLSASVGWVNYREYEEEHVYTQDDDGNRTYTNQWKLEYYESEHAKDMTEGDCFLLKTYVGFGTAIYPFRNKNSAMNGFFFGGSAGYALYTGTGEESFVNLGLAYQAEIGKDWWIGKNFSIGTSLIYSHTTPVMDIYDSDSGENTIGIMLRLTRG